MELAEKSYSVSSVVDLEKGDTVLDASPRHEVCE